MEFTQNYWSQRDVMNKIIILTKLGTDMIQAVIPTKFKKYPSTTILKHAGVLFTLNKSPWGCLQNMTPHDAYSIPIHVCTLTLS